MAQEPIPARVVESIANREHLDQKLALQRAADTLRLALAYRQDKRRSFSPELSRFLKVRKAVDLWLRDVFEPQHGPESIPAKELAAAMKNAAKSGALFRPELHGICQFIVRPQRRVDQASKDTKDRENIDARELPGFESEARDYVKSLWRGLLAARKELLATESCDLFSNLTQSVEDTQGTQLNGKRERMLIDLGSDRWDRDFVQVVSAVKEPTLLAPFMTRFGLHVVLVAQVMPAKLAAPNEEKVPPKLQAAREELVRESMLTQWRSKALKETLESLRKSRDIQDLRSTP